MSQWHNLDSKSADTLAGRQYAARQADLPGAPPIRAETWPDLWNFGNQHFHESFYETILDEASKLVSP
jgi:hypothetical protein